MRKAAKDDAAWAPYADLLSMEYRDGEIQYVVTGTPEQHEEIDTLEYGGLGDTPAPFLRTFSMRQNAILAKRLESIIAQEVPLV